MLIQYISFSSIEESVQWKSGNIRGSGRKQSFHAKQGLFKKDKIVPTFAYCLRAIPCAVYGAFSNRGAFQYEALVTLKAYFISIIVSSAVLSPIDRGAEDRTVSA